MGKKREKTGDRTDNNHSGTSLNYRQFFDHLEELMVLLDVGQFPPHILDMNRAAREMYLHGKTDAEGVPFTEFFSGEEQQLVEDHLRRVLQEKEVIFETTHNRHDGSMAWLQVTLRLIRQEDKEVILCLQQDITEKKKMLSSAREKHEKYEDIYEHAATGLFESTIDGSRFISFNESFRKITGYSAADLRVTPPDKLWYIAEERDFFIKALQRKGWVEGYVSRLRTAQGRLYYVILSARMNREKKTFTGSVIDVTQRYRDELLRNVIYNISDAAFTGGSLHELLITINLELTRLIKSKNLLIGLVNEKTGMLTLPYMRDEKKVIRSFPLKLTISRLVIENDEPLFLKKPELERLTREGRINTARSLPEVWLGVPLHDNNHTFGILALQDYHNPDAFTEEDFKLLTYVGNQISMSLSRKQTEEEVRRLKLGFEQSPISVVITDSDGYIQYVNPFFENLTGYSFSEVKGKNPRILKSGKTPLETYKELWATVTKKKVWTGEFLNKKKNDELYWESAVISPVFDGYGNLINYIALKEDITLRKKYEKGLKEALLRAEESDKLKTAFLATISHELRTPLNAIIGFSEMLMEQHVDTMTGRFSENIFHSGKELLKIIEDILNLSLIESKTLRFSYEDLPLILLENLVEDEFIQKNRKYKKPDLFWSVEMDETLRQMSLHTDRKYLVYVISLIIDNALKFTDRGNVRIKIEGHGTDLLIHVQDTGPGIEARHREVIFSKFRQLEDPFTRRFGGTGIGLTIAGEVVRLMGGTIEVESEPGKGSRFTIRVPGLEKSGTTTGEIPQPDAQQMLQDKQVLVVEDEELNFLLLKELLKSRGAELLWARNGREALELTERHSSVFLVLMDIRMPVMNGLEATRVLKTKNPALPVIALTAYNMHEDKEKAYEAGCDAFLTKPVNKETLFTTIRKVVSAG